MFTSDKALPARGLLFAAVLFGFTLGVSDAWAQVPEAAQSTASPGRVEEQFQDDVLQPGADGTGVEVRDVILQQVPAGAGDIRFELTSIQLDGVTVYTESQLRPVYGDKLGTTVSLAEIYGIATALTSKYRNEGYILTQVIVPPQTIDGGAVRLRVVEGYIDRVYVEGPEGDQGLALIRTYAGNIRTGKALNVRDLERWLLLVNDLPGVEARSVLSPSPTQTGGADLRILVTRDPFDGLAAIDNHGSRYLGPLQTSGVASFNNLLNLNDRITAQTVLAPQIGGGGFEMAYFALAYMQPIGPHGTILEITGNHSNTDPGYDLRIFDVDGRSNFFSVKATHPFVRSRTVNVRGYGTFDWRDVKTKNILDSREDRIRAVRAGLNLQFLDTIFGAGANALNIEVAKGLDVFGASSEGDNDLTRLFADPQFFKTNIEVQRLQRLTNSVNLLLAGSGQWSAHPLVSSEEFGVGGPILGRGYDPSEIIGDDGLAGKVEVQWNQPHPFSVLENYQLFGFYDAGVVWNQDATTSATKRDTATSTGFGIRADFTDTVQAGAAVAFPLNRDVQTQKDNDPRVYVNVNKTF